jgi:hypothetical protein
MAEQGRNPLPVLVKERTEFGYYRTSCGCRPCTLNCEHNPGYLIPADLYRLTRDSCATEQEVLDWAARHLVAAAPVGATEPGTGRQFQVRVLLPAHKADGCCHFLTDDKRCSVHADAPFGCAFFDCATSAQQSAKLHGKGLAVVARAWELGELYAQVWRALHAQGRVSPPGMDVRLRLYHAAKAEGLI